MITKFAKIHSNNNPEDYGFYFIEKDNIKYGYIGTRNDPILFIQEKEEGGNTLKRTKGLSMGCLWSDWKIII